MKHRFLRCMFLLGAFFFIGCTNPASYSDDGVEEPKVATIPVAADLIGTWKFSYGSVLVNDDTWIFNSDLTFYYTNFSHNENQYSYKKGTWSLSADGVFSVVQTHKSPTTTAADITSLGDWMEESNSFSASSLLYDHNLFLGTYFSNAMGIMTRVGTGSGIVGDWSYVSVDGLVKIEETFDAQNFTVTRFTRTATSGDGSTWIMDKTNGIPGPVSGGTYTVSGSTVSLVVPSGYQGPAGTHTQYMAISEPFLLSSSVLSTGMIKQ